MTVAIYRARASLLDESWHHSCTIEAHQKALAVLHTADTVGALRRWLSRGSAIPVVGLLLFTEPSLGAAVGHELRNAVFVDRQGAGIVTRLGRQHQQRCCHERG